MDSGIWYYETFQSESSEVKKGEKATTVVHMAVSLLIVDSFNTVESMRGSRLKIY